MSADMIVNMAKGAWEVIKDGKPSTEITGSTANAVPQVDDWTSLESARGPLNATMGWTKWVGWPAPDHTYVYVDFKILLKWTYGATYKGGGLFIPNVWIEVPECYAGWSWDVNISLTTRNPENFGTKAAPIARLPVTIRGSVSTYEQSHNVDWGVVVYGNGRADT
jgi:hypothetical protein